MYLILLPDFTGLCQYVLRGRVPIGGPGGNNPLAGSRGSAPCGGQGALPPEAEHFLKFDKAENQFPCIFF